MTYFDELEQTARKNLADAIEDIVNRHLLEMAWESLAQAFERVADRKIDDLLWECRIACACAACDSV